MAIQTKKRIETGNKTSSMFNKQLNRTGKYLGDKECLDEEQFRVQLET